MDNIDGWVAKLGETLREIFSSLLDHLPAVLAALALLLVGWLAAYLGRRIVRRLIDGLDWVLGHAVASSKASMLRLQTATARIVSELSFWIILLIFAISALRMLGSPVVDQWMANLLGYLPALISGILIILAGIVGGTVLNQIVAPAASGIGIARSALLGRLTQAVVIIIGLLIGIAHIGIDVSFLVNIITVLVAAALGSIALSLALGTHQHIANIVGARYARKYYRIGDTVRIGEIEGRLINVADGYLFLETESGDLSLPASIYTRESILKITERSGE